MEQNIEQLNTSMEKNIEQLQRKSSFISCKEEYKQIMKKFEDRIIQSLHEKLPISDKAQETE